MAREMEVYVGGVKEDAEQILAAACGEKCWNVSVGGVTLPDFTLDLGEKVKKKSAVVGDRLPGYYFEGSISFYVMCWWRLEHRNSVLATAYDCETQIVCELGLLVGKSLVGVHLIEPAWDLVLDFDDAYCLKCFSHRSSTANALLKNWDASVSGKEVTAGPGMALEIG